MSGAAPAPLPPRRRRARVPTPVPLLRVAAGDGLGQLHDAAPTPGRRGSLSALLHAAGVGAGDGTVAADPAPRGGLVACTGAKVSDGSGARAAARRRGGGAAPCGDGDGAGRASLSSLLLLAAHAPSPRQLCDDAPDPGAASPVALPALSPAQREAEGWTPPQSPGRRPSFRASGADGGLRPLYDAAGGESMMEEGRGAIAALRAAAAPATTAAG
eukprot:gene45849-36001_t